MHADKQNHLNRDGMMIKSAKVWALLRVGALLGAVGFAGTTPLHAQQSTTRGFNLGVQLQGAAIVFQNDREDSGGGIGIRAGYGFNRIVTAFLEIDGAAIDVANSPDLTGDWAMAHVDIGARFHFANALRRWVPYLEAAFTSRVVGVNEGTANGNTVRDVSFNGGAFTGGGGLNIYLSRTVALDVNLKVSGGEFTNVNVGAVSVGGLDIDAASRRLGLGVVWWP